MFTVVFLVILVNLISLSLSLPIESFTGEPLGANPCTWGPSYWCSSIEHAQQCGLDWSDCAKYLTTPTPTPSPSP